MKARYVVDTNVLIAASAADPVHPKDIDATPAEPLLRLQIWQWLDSFRASCLAPTQRPGAFSLS